jgi:hypothetical protein
MTHSDARPDHGENTLETLVELYPLAFAVAATSSSRAGLALRRREPARPVCRVELSYPPNQPLTERVLPAR